jgi:hypothetical protein
MTFFYQGLNVVVHVLGRDFSVLGGISTVTNNVSLPKADSSSAIATGDSCNPVGFSMDTSQDDIQYLVGE